ncbi:protein kinase domain-containing protein, cytoplasmic [Platysternon megacephalum]|uniref:Protein kinase domain-containing protein, cytoplasmic n=1 Tax=Platysternon megacephalum TaxID=55544 RepID=A0A4D9E1T4_9SAUR|nr:protein kinase domain-containing protein, cytoplasmic [Platysternon megacephalum]
MMGHMQKRRPYTHLLGKAGEGERQDTQLLVEGRLGDGRTGEQTEPLLAYGEGVLGGMAMHTELMVGCVGSHTEPLVGGDGRRGPQCHCFVGERGVRQSPPLGKGTQRAGWQRGDWGELHGAPAIEGEQ